MSKKLYHQFACSSLILPEHRAQLQHARDQKRRQEELRRPLLDEQEAEQFQYALEQSQHCGLALRVTLLSGDGYRTVTGIACRTDPVSGKIFLHTASGIRAVSTAEIIAVTLEKEGGDSS
ncbi:MAG: YolD-like family protein [Firmicutes bacterium]|jgi:hypothetical protein|nr:YolD-like family protein [Bacillota bacterium]